MGGGAKITGACMPYSVSESHSQDLRAYLMSLVIIKIQWMEGWILMSAGG